MSDLESIYMQRSNEENDLMSSYAKTKSISSTNEINVNHSESTSHTSIYDSIHSKKPESEISSLFNDQKSGSNISKDSEAKSIYETINSKSENIHSQGKSFDTKSIYESINSKSENTNNSKIADSEVKHESAHNQVKTADIKSIYADSEVKHESAHNQVNSIYSDPAELHSNPEFLNNDSVAHDLNVRGSRYGNMSITDKMRGVQANRLDNDGGEISLAEMYNDSSLDNRVAGGRYNVTMSDIYSDERKWRALNKLNTDGKIEVAENYQIDNELVKAKEIKSTSNNESLKSNNIPTENESLKKEINYFVDIAESEKASAIKSNQPQELYKKIDFDTVGKIQDFSFNKGDNKKHTNEDSNYLNPMSNESLLITGIATAANTTSSLFSNKDQSSLKNDSLNPTNKSSLLPSTNLQSASISLSSTTNTGSFLKNEDTVEPTLIDKYREKELVNKDNSTEIGAYNAMTVDFDSFKFNKKPEDINENSDYISIPKNSALNSSSNENFLQVNKETNIVNFNEKLDFKIQSKEIIATGLVAKTAIDKVLKKEVNKTDNISVNNEDSEFIFKGKVNGEVFDYDKYVNLKFKNKNEYSEFNLSELITLKNELLECKINSKSELTIETIELKLKIISREMIKKAF